MADEIVVRKEKQDPPPEGQFKAVCVDVVNMGEKLDTYQGKTEISARIEIVFQISADDPKTGKPYLVGVEKVLSFGPKSGLRKFLEQWRGKAYTNEQADAGVPLHRLVGQSCLLTLEHKESASGNLYTKVNNIVPLPGEMKPLAVRDYSRPPFYDQRKQEWARTVAEYRTKNTPRSYATDDEAVTAAVAGVEADDDLPF